MNNIQDFYNINHFPGDYDVNYCVSAATNGLNPYINFILDSIKKSEEKVIINQKICEIQNSGFNWGIPPLSAPFTFVKSAILKTKE